MKLTTCLEGLSRFGIATLLVWNTGTTTLQACSNHPKKTGEAGLSGQVLGAQATFAGAKGLASAGASRGAAFQSALSESSGFFRSIGSDPSEDPEADQILDEWTSKIE